MKFVIPLNHWAHLVVVSPGNHSPTQEVSFCTLWPLTTGKHFNGTLVPMTLSSLLPKVEGKMGVWAVGDPLHLFVGKWGREVLGGSQWDTHTACPQPPFLLCKHYSQQSSLRSCDRELPPGTQEEGFSRSFCLLLESGHFPVRDLAICLRR